MKGADDWGRDPQVQALRRVFAALEQAEAELLNAAGLGPWDPRLRAWREQARQRFMAAWPRALGQGLARQPQAAGRLYALGLAGLLAQAGVAAPLAAQPGDEGLAAALREAGP
ncbi:MAG: hypothetical protein AB1814_10850 [Thermodesulfobacteriota bacterium]